MSWNERLYLYAQKHGGEYLGGTTDGRDLFDSNVWAGCDGVLILEHRDGPLLAQCLLYGGGRSAVTYTAKVRLRCQLEREYSLKISPKSAVRQGLNTVLGQLDKGIGMLNGDLDLYQDYGCAEVLAGRTVRTNETQFTQMVFRDLELRNALLANPRYGVLVEKSTPYLFPGPMHQISAFCALSTAGDDWDIEPVDYMCSEEEKRKALMEDTTFEKRLDALIELAKAAHGAVMAWRMPEKRIDK